MTTRTGTAKVFSSTLCVTPSFSSREVSTMHVHEAEMEDYLDEYGCHDELEQVMSLSIGESKMIGFPQGSFRGLIIVRVA